MGGSAPGQGSFAGNAHPLTPDLEDATGQVQIYGSQAFTPLMKPIFDAWQQKDNMKGLIGQGVYNYVTRHDFEGMAVGWDGQLMGVLAYSTVEVGELGDAMLVEGISTADNQYNDQVIWAAIMRANELGLPLVFKAVGSSEDIDVQYASMGFSPVNVGGREGWGYTAEEVSQVVESLQTPDPTVYVPPKSKPINMVEFDSAYSIPPAQDPLNNGSPITTEEEMSNADRYRWDKLNWDTIAEKKIFDPASIVGLETPKDESGNQLKHNGIRYFVDPKTGEWVFVSPPGEGVPQDYRVLDRDDYWVMETADKIDRSWMGGTTEVVTTIMHEWAASEFGGEPVPRERATQVKLGVFDDYSYLLLDPDGFAGFPGVKDEAEFDSWSDKEKAEFLEAIVFTGEKEDLLSQGLDRAMSTIYENTQEMLAQAGYEEGDTVRLYRGLASSPEQYIDGDEGWAELEQYALSSWSFSKSVAAQFATEAGSEWSTRDTLEGEGTLVSADIPIDRLFSHASTGPGSGLEMEWVVIGDEPFHAYLQKVTSGMTFREHADAMSQLTGVEQKTEPDMSVPTVDLKDPKLNKWMRAEELLPAAADPSKAIDFISQEPTQAIERGGPGSGHHGHAGRPGQVGGSAPRELGRAQEGHGDTRGAWSEDTWEEVLTFIEDEWEPTTEISRDTMDWNYWLMPDGRIFDVNEHRELNRRLFEEFGERLFEARKFPQLEHWELKKMGFVRANFHPRPASNIPTLFLEFNKDALTKEARASLRDMYWVAMEPEIGRVNIALDWEDNAGEYGSLTTSGMGVGGAQHVGLREINQALGFRIDRSLTKRGGPGSGHHGHKGRPGEVGGSAPSGAVTSEPAPAKFSKETLDLFAESLFLGSQPWEVHKAANKLSYWLERESGADLDLKYRIWKWNEEKGESDSFEFDRATVIAIHAYFEELSKRRYADVREMLGVPHSFEEWVAMYPDWRKPPRSEGEKEYRAFWVRALQFWTNHFMETIENGDPTAYTNSEVHAALLDLREVGEAYLGEDTPESRDWNDYIFAGVEYTADSVYTFAIKHRVTQGVLTPEEADNYGGYAAAKPQGRTWEELPEVVYHVTTAAAAVREDQLRSRLELGIQNGPGLGGGESDTISVTTDLETAKIIEIAFHEARFVARGELTVRQLIQNAADGVGADQPWAGSLMGRWWGNSRTAEELEAIQDNPWEDLPPQYDLLLKMEDAVLSGTASGEDRDRYDRNKWEFYNTYMSIRSHAPGGWTNPLFFGTDTAALAASDPADFVVLEYRPKPGSRGYHMGSLAEWRLVGGDVLELTNEINVLSPGYDEEQEFNAGMPFETVRAAGEAVFSIDGIPAAIPASWLRDPNQLDLVERGGPGSGHHGHRGRPGYVGGSQPRGSEINIRPHPYAFPNSEIDFPLSQGTPRGRRGEPFVFGDSREILETSARQAMIAFGMLPGAVQVALYQSRPLGRTPEGELIYNPREIAAWIGDYLTRSESTANILNVFEQVLDDLEAGQDG